jgi:hypothetical protein
MENRSQKILSSLTKYYSDVTKLNLMQSIIQSHDTTNKVSLRLVDWLVTNYSKSHNIVYYVSDMPFNVHQSYKNMLKAYSKKLFDPFRRHDRVYLRYPDAGIVETTVAQLTFFKWAIENDVLSYAFEHRNNIKADMDLNTKHRKNSEDLYDKHKTKRKELSKKTKGANIYNVNIRVTFT